MPSNDRCPRCRGRMFPEDDPATGPELYCLSGHRVQLGPVLPAPRWPESSARTWDRSVYSQAGSRAGVDER